MTEKLIYWKHSHSLLQKDEENDIKDYFFCL